MLGELSNKGLGIIGPTLVSKGMAHGVQIFSQGDPGYERWKDLVSFNSFNLKDPINHPSPRYWLLWPYVSRCRVLGLHS